MLLTLCGFNCRWHPVANLEILKKGGGKTIYQPRSRYFIANAHNELCAFYGIRRLTEKNSEANGAADPITPFIPLEFATDGA